MGSKCRVLGGKWEGVSESRVCWGRETNDADSEDDTVKTVVFACAHYVCRLRLTVIEGEYGDRPPRDRW